MKAQRTNRAMVLERLEDRLVMSIAVVELATGTLARTGTPVTLDPLDGKANLSGQISRPGERDVFRLDAAKAGAMNVEFTPGPRFKGNLTVSNDSGHKLWSSNVKKGVLTGTIETQQGQDLAFSVSGSKKKLGSYEIKITHPTYVNQCELYAAAAESDDIVSRAKAYMDSLAIDSLTELGTIYVRADGTIDAFDMTPGIYVLRPIAPATGEVDLSTNGCWTAYKTDRDGEFEPLYVDTNDDTSIPDTGIDLDVGLPTDGTGGGFGGFVDTNSVGLSGALQGSTSIPMDIGAPQGLSRILLGATALQELSTSPLSLARPEPLEGLASSPLGVAAGDINGDGYRVASGSRGSGGFKSSSVGFGLFSPANPGGPAGVVTVAASFPGTTTMFSTPGTVVRYEGDITSNVAVILANKVVFEDASITLSDSVTEFFIVAATIESSGGSAIRWERAYTVADDHADPKAASDGTSFGASAAAFNAPDGGDGADATVVSKTGNNGLDAPDVYVIVKEFVDASDTELIGDLSFPSIDVRGQHAGRGQSGQDGGDGGDGAPGLDAESNWFHCVRGAGWGGDGGDSGDGADGGDGGRGGDGGNFSLSFVSFPDNISESFSPSFISGFLDGERALDGGWGGAGGDGGTGGRGGEGGDAGDGDEPWCQEEPDRAGSDGRDGSDGSPGDAGQAGSDGQESYDQITLEEWEAAFTTPYLVSADEPNVTVGDKITFTTYNVSGSATLVLDDYLDTNTTSTLEYVLTDEGDGLYSWSVPNTLTATRFTASIRRDHDGKSTNTYAIEVLPDVQDLKFGWTCIPSLDDKSTSDIDESVVCSAGSSLGTTYLTEDAFEARLGGSAHLIGYGLRADSEVVYDGTSLGLPVAGLLDDGRDILSFTIPIRETFDTYFAQDDGETEHTVYLDQVHPLDDTGEETFTLLKNYRLTFQPSVNGYEFSNSDMTPEAKDAANDDLWYAFRETYGEAEVDAKLIEAGISITAAILGGGPAAILAALTGSTDLFGSFLIYSVFWSDDIKSAVCTGMSVNALKDYFGGASSQVGVTASDVVWTVMLAQSHLLSEEILGSLVLQMLTPAASTEDTVSNLVAFLRDGSSNPTEDSPVLVFAPEIKNLDDVAKAHTVVPYQVVYADPSDSLPSRIYIYDSNAPSSAFDTDASVVDRVFLEIHQDGGDVEFDFNMLDNGSLDYIYNSDDGWVLTYETVDHVLSDVDMPLSFLDLVMALA